ncbi:hypothetical protein QCA50_011848 [Cerrena zonata]|uniref:Uncharacterized protein n=1 Tax=Cerrena zonata TaxID=2478898 RepID=A0AAW0FTR3_9APHY
MKILIPSEWEDVKCTHNKLSYTPSPWASKTAYVQPKLEERIAACRLSPQDTAIRTTDHTSPGTFPAPLVFPEDDLDYDSDYPAQDVASWKSDPERNEVTPDRKTIYVVAPPETDEDMYFIEQWTNADFHAGGIPPSRPDVGKLERYIAAFYHGMTVKRLENPKLTFTNWDSGAKTKKISETPRYIGLKTETECTRIRTRAGRDSVYVRQLNLDDLLDAAIDIVPKDAYALLLLVHHDLYENNEDDWTCGRAYGGSRVAVVSTARYNPLLDNLSIHWVHEVPQHHAWPASHCETYIQDRCTPPSNPITKKRKTVKAPGGDPASSSSNAEPEQTQTTTPLSAALSAYAALDPPLMLWPTGLWFSRTARTVTHELGHCFGIEHCVYYACCMQGSASIAEDVRQPPYLCPVDLKKVLVATGTGEVERYRRLLEFCEGEEWVDKWEMFVGYAAWIRERLKVLEREQEQEYSSA